MKILVTGASGFCGAHVARALARAGCDVTATFRRETPFLKLIDGESGILLLRAALTQSAELPGPFAAVVHIAATSAAPGISAETIMHDNLEGTRALISAARAWPDCRLIFFSSLSLYGDIEVPVVDETTPMRNPDAYGRSKYLCECLLAEAAPALPSIAFRLPGVIGPGAHRNWLSGVAAKLQTGRPIPAFNLDAPFNNAVHISGLSDLVLALAQRSWEGSDAVVLGAGGTITVRDAIEQLAEGLGVGASIEESPSDRRSFTLSSQRAMAKWGYHPADIGLMIERYAADLRSWQS